MSTNCVPRPYGPLNLLICFPLAVRVPPVVHVSPGGVLGHLHARHPTLLPQARVRHRRRRQEGHGHGHQDHRRRRREGQGLRRRAAAQQERLRLRDPTTEVA